MLALHRASPRQQASYVLPAKDAVLPAAQAGAQGSGVLGRLRRSRAEAGEELAELGANGLGVAERNARADERDELPIRRVCVAVREADGVCLASSV